ncbi:MAG: amidohydrolase family protein [Solirubrobacteraceae bacterium]
MSEQGATQVADTVVRGGIVVDGAGMSRRDVVIGDGVITDVVAPGYAPEAREVIDASGRYVLPGIIDAHLHPVYTDRIDTISASAALGGTTTIVGFIGAIKAWGGTGTIVDAVQAFVEEGEATSMIDFAAHGSICRDDLELLSESIPQLVEMGVTSFKCFMAYRKRGMMLDDPELLRVLEIVAASGGLFQVHAENGNLLDHLQDGFIAQGLTSPEYHSRSCPNLAETEAVMRIATLAATVGCPLYLVHLSARQSLDLLRLWRTWGSPSPLHTETCIHYLTLLNEELRTRGTLAKVGPPLREQEDIDALWTAVADGLIEVVSTDFAGQAIAKKEPIQGDVFKAPSGLPGIGNLLSIVYDAGVNTGRITLPKLVSVLCEAPARIFGMYPRKGTLSPGSDADLVVFDPSATHVIRAAEQRLKTDYSMWEGRECVGAPTLVMQRGAVLVSDGELKATPGQGVFLPRDRHNQNDTRSTANGHPRGQGRRSPAGDHAGVV